MKLPRWAKNAEEFLKVQRDALESSTVDKHLHSWINLIFGYQQKGEEAIAANNVFHPMSYEGTTDIEKITDLHERSALEMQIMEFGQTPKQLFIKPHPAKYSYDVPKSLPTKEEDKCSNNTSDKPASASKKAIDSTIGAWLKDIGSMKATKLPALHKKKINYVYGIENDTQFVTGSKDGTGKVFTFAEGTQKKVLFAREVGARCGTAFRTERIIAVTWP